MNIGIYVYYGIVCYFNGFWCIVEGEVYLI